MRLVEQLGHVTLPVTQAMDHAEEVVLLLLVDVIVCERQLIDDGSACRWWRHDGDHADAMD